MTEVPPFDRVSGTSHSALATSTPHAGAVSVPKPRVCCARGSSQGTQRGCQSTRGEYTSWLSDTRRCQVYLQTRPYWFRCQAAHPQRREHGRPNAWRSPCMELDWVIRSGQASKDVFLSVSPRRPSTPPGRLSGNTMSPSRSPCAPPPPSLHSSPGSLFSSTTSSRKAGPFLPPRPACMRPFLMLTSEPLRSFERWASSRRSMILSSPVRARCGGRRRMLVVSLDCCELMPRAQPLHAASSTERRGGFD